MNSAASQSSSSGWVGHSPCEPRSSSVFDSPVPKNCRQARLTNARAVSGFRARRASRRGRGASRAGRRCELAEESGDRRVDDVAGIVHPVAAGRTRVSRGVGIASLTTTRGSPIQQASSRGLEPGERAGERREVRRTELEVRRRTVCGPAIAPAPAITWPGGRRRSAFGASVCSRRAGRPRYSFDSSTALSSTVPPAIASSATRSFADKREAEPSDGRTPIGDTWRTHG